MTAPFSAQGRPELPTTSMRWVLLPFVMGLMLLLAAAGIATVKTRVLPLWLGWVVLPIFLMALTPIGFVAFGLAGLWVIVVSILLALRARREPPRVDTAPASSPAPA